MPPGQHDRRRSGIDSEGVSAAMMTWSMHNLPGDVGRPQLVTAEVSVSDLVLKEGAGRVRAKVLLRELFHLQPDIINNRTRAVPGNDVLQRHLGRAAQS